MVTGALFFKVVLQIAYFAPMPRRLPAKYLPRIECLVCEGLPIVHLSPVTLNDLRDGNGREGPAQLRLHATPVALEQHGYRRSEVFWC